MLTAALAGNPNTGKTSLFNLLTGSYEYVGNWPGVTVEKKVGKLRDLAGRLIDLPGVYSLNPLSKDEGVAARFFVSEPFAAIVNVVDASQLARNLMLTVQLLELGKPLMIALNMVDVAEKRGIFIDVKRLAKSLGVPVIPVIARTGQGKKQIADCLSSLPQQGREPLRLYYGLVVESAIHDLQQMLPANGENARWYALQVLEGNPEVLAWLSAKLDIGSVRRLIRNTEQKLAETGQVGSLARYIHGVRVRQIARIVDDCLSRHGAAGKTFSERVDDIVTNRFLGLPVFFAVMFLMFKFTFDWAGTPLSDRLDALINGPVAGGLATILNGAGVAPFVRDVVLAGIVPGVGGVLVFVPQIFILFFFISLIEDSGYMARVAFVLDKLAETIGLNGKSFIPLVIGFGCNVPGVMAARTVEQPRDRLLTILLLPLMSCSARLAVYSLFVGAFFQAHQAAIVLSLYVVGIAVSIMLAKLFSATILKERHSGFVIELPPYRVPQTRTLLLSTWEKGKGFVRKAGTIIFGGSVAIWLLGNMGSSGWDVPMDESFLASLGSLLAPLFAPLGFANWQAGAALLTGFLAKEVVVSTMNIIYNAPDLTALQHAVAGPFSPLSAYSFMLFLLLYVPCLATVAAIRKETMSARWTWFAVGYGILVAYALSALVYQGGRLLGWE